MAQRTLPPGRRLSVLLLAASALLIAAGAARGEMPELFQKAIRICLECIGIG